MKIHDFYGTEIVPGDLVHVTESRYNRTVSILGRVATVSKGAFSFHAVSNPNMGELRQDRSGHLYRNHAPEHAIVVNELASAENMVVAAASNAFFALRSA